MTRQMPPWHIDKTVGVHEFKNDRSLTDDQIATIVRWVDSGAPQGDLKDMPPPRQWPADNEWKAAKELGQPDLMIKSDPYTMAAHHQDVWWRPTSNIPVTEPRWVRAVEIRPTTAAGRSVTHHAVAYLAQDDPGSVIPGPQRRWSARHPDGMGHRKRLRHVPAEHRQTADARLADFLGHPYSRRGRTDSGHVELGIWLYPKGQEPKYRTYLTAFQALPERRGKTGDAGYSAELFVPDRQLYRADAARPSSRISSLTCTSVARR